MFRKLFSFLLVLMLALSVTLSFVACGDDEDNGDGDGDGTSDNGGSGDTGNGGNGGTTGGGPNLDDLDDGTEFVPEQMPTPPAAQIIKDYTIKVVDQTGKPVNGVIVKIVDYDEKGAQKGEKQGTTVGGTETAPAAVGFSMVESPNLRAQVVSVPEGYVMGSVVDGKTVLKYDTKVEFTNYVATLTVVKPTGYIITAADAAGNVYSGVEITYGTGDTAIKVVTDVLGMAVLDITPAADTSVALKYETKKHVVDSESAVFTADQKQTVLVVPAIGTVAERPETIEAIDKISLEVGETRYYTITVDADKTFIIRDSLVSVTYGEETFVADDGKGIVAIPVTAGEAAFAVTSIATTDLVDVVTELVAVNGFANISDNVLGVAIPASTATVEGSAWFEIDYAAGQYVIIDVGTTNTTASVIYREHRYTPMNGKIEFILNANGENAMFKLVAGADAIAETVDVKLITPINDETDIVIPAGESIWISVPKNAVDQYLLVDDTTVTADGYTFGNAIGNNAETKYFKLTAGASEVETVVKPVTPLTVGANGATVTVKGGKTCWFSLEGAGKYVFIENADAMLDGIGESAVTAISGIVAAKTNAEGKTEFCLTVGEDNVDLVIKLVAVTEIDDTNPFPISVNANKNTTVWYKAPAEAGSYIFMLDDSAKAKVVYNGKAYTTSGGVLSVPVTDEDGFVIFSLTFTETVADKKVTELSIADIETLEKLEATATVEAAGSVWFVYSAAAGDVINVKGNATVVVKGVAGAFADGKITFTAAGTAYIKITNSGTEAVDVTLMPITVVTTGNKVNIPADSTARYVEITYTANQKLVIDNVKVKVFVVAADGTETEVEVADDATKIEIALGATAGKILLKLTSEEAESFTATFTLVAVENAPANPAA